MSLIEQLQTDVARHQRQLEERLAELKAEILETRKVLTSVAKYRARLHKQHPGDEAMLPLAPPDDEEEEATDEADDREPRITDGMDGPVEPLVPDEWSPDYETPMSPSEEEQYAQDLAVAEEAAKPWKPADARQPEKPIRRRKAKAIAEE